MHLKYCLLGFGRLIFIPIFRSEYWHILISERNTELKNETNYVIVCLNLSLSNNNFFPKKCNNSKLKPRFVIFVWDYHFLFLPFFSSLYLEIYPLKISSKISAQITIILSGILANFEPLSQLKIKYKFQKFKLTYFKISENLYNSSDGRLDHCIRY